MSTATATIEPPAEPTNALALIETKPPLELFSNNGLAPILAKIEQEARAEAALLDISTPAGRKAIASLAHKLARTKTTIDAAGKQLVAGWKNDAKQVDAERARGWDFLEALQAEVRAPLTAWENAEKARVAAHEAALAAIPEGPYYGTHETAAELAQRLDYLENLPPRDWQEFSARAAKTLADEIDRTKALHAATVKREAEAAELERLRREKAEREQREREEQIAADAARRAREQAEAEAHRKADEEAARVKQQQEADERDRQRLADAAATALREKEQADARAKKADEDRIAAEAKAEADRKAAAEKAAQERKDAEESAAKRERERIEAEDRQRQEDAAAREADLKHRAKVNRYAMEAINEMIEAFAATGNSPSKAIIEAIARGKIPNVKISY